jgi:hypothetical protein
MLALLVCCKEGLMVLKSQVVPQPDNANLVVMFNLLGGIT